MRRRNVLLTLFAAISICFLIGGFLFLRSAYLLNRIRSILEDQLGKQLQQPLVFSVESNVRSELDNGTLPEALRRAFEDYEIIFSPGVSVEFLGERGEWLVTDKNHKWRYAIRQEEDTLNVYKYVVRIGGLSGNVLTGLSIKQLEVADNLPRHPALISAEEIQLKYKLWGLLSGKFIVTNLGFKRPELNARMQPNGQLNLISLVPDVDLNSSAKFPFQFAISHIELADGSVHYEDSERHLKIAISGIHSRVDGPLDRWDHTGHLAIQDGSFELNDVETKIDEFKTQFELLANKGELKEMRLAVGDSHLTIAGKVSNFKDVSPSVETRIDLNIDFQDFQDFLADGFEVDGSAQINLEAKGTFSDITGQFGLALPFARLNDIQLENLIVEAEFTQDNFRLTKVNGTLASGRLTGGAEIRTIRNSPEPKRITQNPPSPVPTSGDIAQRSFAYDGWLEFAGVQVEELLPMFLYLPEDFLIVKGNLNSRVQFSGDSLDPRALKLSGDLKMDKATLNDVPIRVSEATYGIEGDQFQFVANLDEAQIEVSGQAGLASQLGLALKIRQIDMGKLTRILRVPDLSGDGTLTGKISSEVPLAGFLKIPEASLFDVPIGVLTADFHYKDGEVFLHPVHLCKGTSDLTIDGIAQIGGDIPVDFTVRVQPFQIADYVRLLAGADYPIEGVVTGNLALDGTLRALDGRGKLQIVEAEAWELTLDPLVLPLEVEDYVLNVSDFEILVRGQRGTIDFQITTDRDYELEFQSDMLRLTELAIARGVPDFQLESEFVVKATGEGNARDPRVDISFDFSEITYASKPQRDVHISGVFMDSALRFEGTGFDGSSQIRGMIESTEGSPYQVFMRSNEIDISPILRIFHEPFGKLPAQASGTLQLNGTLADLTQYTLETFISKLVFDINGQQLTNVAPIKLGFADNVWTVDSFSLADARATDSPFVNCQLTLDDDQAIDFVAESEGFSLERLFAVLGLSPTLSGAARYKLTGGGTLTDPRFALDWAIPSLVLETSITPITVSEASGKAVYADRILTVESSDFLMLGNPVEVEGTVLIDPDNLQSSTFNLHALVANLELNSLERFLPEVSQLDGRLNLIVHLTGTPYEPILNASINIAETTARIFDFPQPIENMNAELQVVGGDNISGRLLTITAQAAECQIGEGHYQGHGSWYLSKTVSQSSLVDLMPWYGEKSLLNSQNPVAFQLQLDGERVNLTDFASYLIKRNLPRIEGRVDARLKLQGHGYRPDRMSGQLVCDNLHVDVDGRELLNLEPIHAQFVEGQLRIDSVRLGGQLSNVQPRTTTDQSNAPGSTFQVSNDVQQSDQSAMSNSQSSPSNIVEWVRTSGEINEDGDLDFDVKLTEFPFAILLPGLTLPLFNNAVWLEGSLTSDIRVRGNTANPIIEAEWEARGRGESTEEFRDTGRAKYQEQVFVIQQTQLTGYGNELNVSGSIPIDLAFQPRDLADRFLDRPIDVQARGHSVNLDFLALFHPRLEQSGGIADVDLRIRGTTAVPYLYGDLSIENGMLKFSHFDTPILNGQFSLQADEGELRIPEFSFQIGDGEYDAEVYLGMAGLFPREFEVRRFTALNAQISDFARNFLSGKIASNLKGYMTAEGQLNLPIDRFVSVGETAWLPEIISPLTLPNLITHAKGQLKVRDLFIDSLDYNIRNLRPIDFQLADRKLSLTEGFILEDERVGINDSERLRLTGFGVWNAAEQLDFTMNMRNFDLAFISDFVPDGYTINGSLNSKLHIGGTGEQPEIVCQWNAPKLLINRAGVDECSGEIAYRNGKLYTKEPARFFIGSNRAYLSGLVPFHLSFDDFRAEPLPQDIEGRLDITIEDLEFLPLILPQVGFAEGTGSVNVTIGGQVSSPQLKGVADLSNLAFNVTDSNINVDQTDVILDFTHEGFEIRHCEGLLNGGAYKAEGFVQSDWHRVRYTDLSATLPGGSIFEEPGYYRVQCDEVNLTMKGEVERDRTLSLPPVRGTVQIIEGEYERHWQQLVKEWFDREADVQFEVWADYPIMRHLRFDLDVVAPNNFWVISDFGKLKIEVSIDGKIFGRIQRPVFIGRIDLLPQSEFSLYTFEYPFTIQEDSYVENTSPFEFNPRYEIYAKTAEPIQSVPLISNDGAVRTRDIEITAHLSGYLRAQQHKHRTQFYAEVLRREAGEEYELTQAQIISILATGDVGAFASQTSPSGVTVPLFLRPSQRYFGDRFARITGFHEARFDISPEAFEKSRFLLTRELFERLLLTYSSTFQIHAEPRIEVEYQIKRGLSITGERSEQGKYGVDLKLEQRF